LKKTVDPSISAVKKQRKEAKRLQSAAVSKKKKKTYDEVVESSDLVELNTLYSHEEIARRFEDLMSARGKKSSDSREMLRQLALLAKLSQAHGVRKEIPMLMHYLSSMFHSYRSMDVYMSLDNWKSCYSALERVVKLLNDDKDLVLGRVSDDDLSAQQAINVEQASVSTLNVVGSVESFLVNLGEEFTKSLQRINPHTKVIEISHLLTTNNSLTWLREIFYFI
jgi:hypothetical protein